MGWLIGNNKRAFAEKLMKDIRAREERENINVIGEVSPEIQEKRTAENVQMNNSKKMQEIREEREKEDEKQEGQLLAIHGAKVKFNSHMGEFKVLNDVPTTQGKLTGTIVEKQIPNFTFNDGFQMLSLTEWQDFGTVNVQDNFALLKKSTLLGTGKMPGNVPPETGKIEFVDSGQVNVPKELKTTGRPLPENDIKVNGYFYNYNGNYEGRVKGQKNGNENDVYACDGTGKEIDTFVNAKKLKIGYSDFGRVCNIVKHEGLSNEENEYIYIAHANYNEGKNEGTTMLARLMTGYSSVKMVDKKTALPDTAVDNLSKYSRKGVIEALLRDIDPSKIDPTDGARFWDGVDFLAWGIDTEVKADSNSKTGHNKFDEYDYVKIKKSLYDKFVMKIKQKYPNGAPYGSSHNPKTDKGSHIHKNTSRGMRAIYTIPASDFSKKEYWITGDFYYKNKTKIATGITATQVAGYSIFWKETK